MAPTLLAENISSAWNPEEEREPKFFNILNLAVTDLSEPNCIRTGGQQKLQFGYR